MAKSFKSVAADLRISALAKFERDIKKWADDAGMCDMAEGDYDHALKVAALIETGEIEDAIDTLLRQDTNPREAQAQMLYDMSKSFYQRHMVLPGHAKA